MKDMFDCLEESYNSLEEQIFLIKVVKNKKRQRKKIYYLKTIGQGDKILWTPKMEESMCLLPVRPSYIIIRGWLENLELVVKFLEFHIP
jgi:hypothetical protein